MKDRHLKKKEVRPRLDDELYARLKAAAKRDKRSMTRQVELYIEQGLMRQGYPIVPAYEKIGERLVRLGKLTKVQADEILRLQAERKDKKRFGEIVLELALMSQQELNNHLNDQ